MLQFSVLSAVMYHYQIYEIDSEWVMAIDDLNVSVGLSIELKIVGETALFLKFNSI